MSGTANVNDEKLTFTQEEFNLKIKNSREGTITEVLDALGHGGMSLKDVKQKLNDEVASKSQAEKDKLEKDKNYKKLREQEKSEYDKKISEANNELKKYKSDALKTKINNKIISEATRQGAVDPTDITALLSSNIKLDLDDGSYSIKDFDGQILSVSDAVSNLLKSKLHLKKANFKPSSVKSDVKGGEGGEGGGNDEGQGGDEDTLSHSSYMREIKDLNEKYRGQHLGSEYNKELNALNTKYSDAIKSSV